MNATIRVWPTCGSDTRQLQAPPGGESADVSSGMRTAPRAARPASDNNLSAPSDINRLWLTFGGPMTWCELRFHEPCSGRAGGKSGGMTAPEMFDGFDQCRAETEQALAARSG